MSGRRRPEGNEEHPRASSEPLPSAPGTYVLVLDAPASGEARIGKLGSIALRGGWLLYVGSAFGPGGLRARVGRHLRKSKTLHWHIDHLLDRVDMTEVWWSSDDTKREEAWAKALRSLPWTAVPLRRFGAGDCGCEGHLVRLEERPRIDLLRARFATRAGHEYTIHRTTPAEIVPD